MQSFILKPQPFVFFCLLFNTIQDPVLLSSSGGLDELCQYIVLGNGEWSPGTTSIDHTGTGAAADFVSTGSCETTEDNIL